LKKKNREQKEGGQSKKEKRKRNISGEKNKGEANSCDWSGGVWGKLLALGGGGAIRGIRICTLTVSRKIKNQEGHEMGGGKNFIK